MANLRFRKFKAVENPPDAPSAPQVPPVLPQSPSLSTTQHTYDEIQAFFEIKLPVMKRASNHTLSINSRPPQIFDKHLHDMLKLKRVIKLDQLTEDLCNVAQAALDYHRRRLPPVTDKLRATFNPSRKIRKVCNEHGVLAIFEHRIPSCVKIASTLAYGSDNWSQVCLAWSTSRLSSLKVEGVHENEAIADGFLNIIESTMAPLLNDVQNAVHRTFPELITWEFKNLNFCGQHGIDSLPDAFANVPFPWQGCEYGNECHITHPEIGVKACRMGYDSETHPCTSYQQVRYRKTKGSENAMAPVPNTNSHIIQQAWAEAVRHDTTFLVINTGNKEVIGIRDRDRQTLYLSVVFEVHESHYMKLHTGLYIAAIRDAEDRMQRLNHSKPFTWFLRSGKDDSKLLDLDSKRDTDVCDIVLKAVQTRHWLRIIPKLREKSLFPFSTRHYRRINNLQDAQYMQSLKQQQFPGSPDSFAEWQAEQFSQEFETLSSVTYVPKDIDTFFFLLVSRPVNKDRTYRPYRAKVELPNSVLQRKRNISIPELIIKEASSYDQIEGLETEWVVHSVLQHAGIQYPSVYGFFFCSEEPCAVLVLEDIGMKKSLKDITSKPGRRKFQMTTLQVDRFRKIMTALHTAGWYHGQLTTDNLLFVKKHSYKVAITGFQGAKLLPDHPYQREAMIHQDMSDLNKLCGQAKSQSICQISAYAYRQKKISALAKAKKKRNKESRH